jgi:RNA polymerase sigma-70 factor (ECF subfamily)
MPGAAHGFQKGRRDIMNGPQMTGAPKDFESSYASIAKGKVGDDHSLVAEAKSGHASAFGALYERHCSRIYRTAFRILRNDPDAEDAVQRTFQRAFVSLARFREDSRFSTWVTRIAINEALMLLRQRPRNRALSEKDNDGTCAHFSVDLPDDRPTPEQALAQTELRNAVIHAISELGHNLRVVVLLREVHGLTNAETARRLGLSVAAVKARSFHARRHLREHFERNFAGTRGGFLIESQNREQSRRRHREFGSSEEADQRSR